MKLTVLKSSIQCQIEAALAMFEESLRQCPEAHWASPVGTHPFWLVAYHTLCWTDMYLSKNVKSWKPEKGQKGSPPGLHPRGRQDLDIQTPARRFERDELLRYVKKCREKLTESLAAETMKSLAGASGFSWIHGVRMETYLYNLRHLAHHTGQLTAFLRRIETPTKWVREVRE